MRWCRRTTARSFRRSATWLRARSSLVFPTQVSGEDRLLTLVTCHGLNENERLAVALRAVRPGEDMKALAAALKEGIRRP